MEFTRYLAEIGSLSSGVSAASPVIKATHFWTEYVGCDAHFYNQSDWSEVFEATGELMAILCLLGSTDMHADNVVLNQKRPVLVDAETVVSNSAPSMNIWKPWDIYSTGVISRSSGCVMSLLASYRQYLNADVYRNRLGLVSAFCKTLYQIKSTVGSGSDLADLLRRTFGTGRARHTLRPSSAYDLLISKILTPKLLRSGRQSAKVADILRLQNLLPRGVTLPQKAVDFEVLSVLRLNIPMFWSDPAYNTLSSTSGDVFARPFSAGHVSQTIAHAQKVLSDIPGIAHVLEEAVIY
jgi:lantibiotic modifying enzyme